MISDREAALSVSLFCRLNIRAKLTSPLRGSDIGLMFYLASEETEHTAAAAATFFMVSRAAVSGMVKSLLSKGLIVKEQSDVDARNYILSLTEEGKKIQKIVEEAYEKKVRVLRDKLGDDNYETFIQLLGRANGVISDELGL